MSKLLTVNEVAVMLRRSPAAIRYMRHAGTGPKSAKVAGRVMWREDDVNEYIEAQFAEASSLLAFTVGLRTRATTTR